MQSCRTRRPGPSCDSLIAERQTPGRTTANGLKKRRQCSALRRHLQSISELAMHDAFGRQVREFGDVCGAACEAWGKALAAAFMRAVAARSPAPVFRPRPRRCSGSVNHREFG